MDRFAIFAVATLVAASAAPLAGSELAFQEGASPTPEYTTGATYICSSADLIFDFFFPLRVGRTSRCAELPSPGKERTLLEFELDALGAPESIVSVRLELTAAGIWLGGTEPALEVALHQLGEGENADFDEGTVSWSTAPFEPGGTVGPQLSTASIDAEAGPVTWPTSPAFEQAVADALAVENPALRMLLLAPAAEQDEESFNSVWFYKDENNAGSGVIIPLEKRPRLVVKFVPEPAPWLQAGAALTALAALSKRRRQTRNSEP